jgi:hypothetical protein
MYAYNLWLVDLDYATHELGADCKGSPYFYTLVDRVAVLQGIVLSATSI